jgi:hypothetical protein
MNPSFTVKCELCDEQEYKICALEDSLNKTIGTAFDSICQDCLEDAFLSLIKLLKTRDPLLCNKIKSILL